MSGRALVLALLAGLSLRLIPPGWGAKAHPLDTTHLRMPTALAHGSRGSEFENPLVLHAEVAPSPARLGQQLLYRGHGYLLHGDRLVFAPPEAGGDFTWGAARAGRKAAAVVPQGMRASSVDSAWVEVPLQVFKTGLVSIPGLLAQVTTDMTPGARYAHRLPTVHLLVLPTLTAADTAATLRPLHGPLGAPWWERVSWRVIAAVAAALLLALGLWRWLAARRRKPLPAAVPGAAARPAVDPEAEALKALAELRTRELPQAGRFGEHALALTRILRRYLERTLGTPRPGDTSAELVARVRASRLETADVQRLEGLLGLWDRVKFARAPLDVAEAGRCETAVESLVRRRDRPQEVA